MKNYTTVTTNPEAKNPGMIPSVKRTCELTVKRPSGVVEVVTHPTIRALVPAAFKQIVAATKKANGSDVISYENIETITWIAMTKDELDAQEHQRSYDATVKMMSGGEYFS